MASSQADIDQALSHLLSETAKSLGILDHPTAKGDGREDIVRELLADRVGTMFGVAKAEVIDSKRNSSNEHDIVVYDQSVRSCLHISGHRRVVRVESLAMTIEVKSCLDSKAMKETSSSIENGLSRLCRFYLKSGDLKRVETLAQRQDPGSSALAAKFDETTRIFKEGLSATLSHQDIPAVVNAIFAYKGPTLQAAANYLGNSFVDIICVLGEYTLTKPRCGYVTTTPKNVEVWGTADNALGAFLYVVEAMLQQYRSAGRWVSPDPYRYYEAIRPMELPSGEE